MNIDDNKIILSFENIGKGQIANNGQKLKWFEICGKNDEFYPAEAKIVNNKIVVWSKKVVKPVAVRYAWQIILRVLIYIIKKGCLRLRLELAIFFKRIKLIMLLLYLI